MIISFEDDFVFSDLLYLYNIKILPKYLKRTIYSTEIGMTKNIMLLLVDKMHTSPVNFRSSYLFLFDFFPLMFYENFSIFSTIGGYIFFKKFKLNLGDDYLKGNVNT